MNDLSTLKNMCSHMRNLQELKEKQEEELKQTNAQLDKLRLIQIPEEMERLEVRTATFEGVGRVQLAGDLHCSTISGRKDEAMQWLRDSGYGDMVQESYNASSMKALIKRMIAEGVDTPDFLDVTPFIRASIVKVG